jgi:hypothetical protein
MPYPQPADGPSWTVRTSSAWTVLDDSDVMGLFPAKVAKVASPIPAPISERLVGLMGRSLLRMEMTRSLSSQALAQPGVRGTRRRASRLHQGAWIAAPAWLGRGPRTEAGVPWPRAHPLPRAPDARGVSLVGPWPRSGKCSKAARVGAVSRAAPPRSSRCRSSSSASSPRRRAWLPRGRGRPTTR